MCLGADSSGGEVSEDPVQIRVVRFLEDPGADSSDGEVSGYPGTNSSGQEVSGYLVQIRVVERFRGV